MGVFSHIVMEGLNFLSALFVFAAGVFALIVLFIFIAGAGQTSDAIRRNYPVIARFRSIFTRLGEFFRQYFFALDGEELPFNRAERDWVHRSSIGAGNTVTFGSTRNLTPAGTVIFVNCPFPTLEEHATDTPEITFGPFTPNPYRFSSIINISAMSFGALSSPAVRALSKGAGMAGCWLNTGEGGLALQHLDARPPFAARAQSGRKIGARKNFVEKMRVEVGTIAHSCGVPHPRALKRFHCRIVQPNGRSIPMNELHPAIAPAALNVPAAL